MLELYLGIHRTRTSLSPLLATLEWMAQVLEMQVGQSSPPPRLRRVYKVLQLVDEILRRECQDVNGTSHSWLAVDGVGVIHHHRDIAISLSFLCWSRTCSLCLSVFFKTEVRLLCVKLLHRCSLSLASLGSILVVSWRLSNSQKSVRLCLTVN